MAWCVSQHVSTFASHDLALAYPLPVSQAEISGVPIASVGKLSWCECARSLCDGGAAQKLTTATHDQVPDGTIHLRVLLAADWETHLAKSRRHEVKNACTCIHMHTHRNLPARCFLAECSESSVEEAQDVLAIPADQTIVANVSTGLTKSDFKCVLDFFKRKTRDLARDLD